MDRLKMNQKSGHSHMRGNVLYPVVALLLLLALIAMWVLGYGPGGSNTCCHQAATPPVAASAARPIAPTPASVAPVVPAVPVVAAPQAPAAEPAVLAAAVPPATILPAPAVANTAPAAIVTQSAALSVAVPPVAKLYFKVNDPNLREDVNERIAEALAYLQANPTSRARLQGFHDPVGDLTHNQNLANTRAGNVRDLLVRSGIAAQRITIDQPSDMTGDGSRPKARRVEVTITP
jgi:outer membrane protein OmpA-like peptidoglycan-associated protein